VSMRLRRAAVSRTAEGWSVVVVMRCSSSGRAPPAGDHTHTRESRPSLGRLVVICQRPPGQGSHQLAHGTHTDARWE
ncbi:MAG: hypothetical protein ABJA74_10485, partial [Lapillicoccus sp.]